MEEEESMKGLDEGFPKMVERGGMLRRKEGNKQGGEREASERTETSDDEESERTSC